MRVQITSGIYNGFTGCLSYDDEGIEWIVINYQGMWRDISATEAQYTMIGN